MVEKSVIRCQSTTTYSSMIGAVTSYIKTFIEGKFPHNFFKRIIISETDANILLDDKDIVRYELPYMVIKPEIVFNENYLETLPQWYETNHYILSELHRYKDYYGIFKDEEQNIYMYTLPTRMKVNFTLLIKVPTQMYADNLRQYMNNSFEKNGYEFINGVRLQTILPKILMINLSSLNGLNINTNEGRPVFNDYVYKNSFNGIEENINLATGNNDYYYNFQVNILNNYPERAQADRNVKNLITENVNITFNFSSELWIPNKFILEAPNNQDLLHQDIMVEDIENFMKGIKFNMVIDTSYILPKIDDKHLLIKRKFLPDVNVEYDELDFSSIMSPELLDALNFLKKENLLNTHIFEALLMCGNKALNKNEYIVDYEHFIIKTKNPMYNTTYTVLLYGNLEKLNLTANKDMPK